MFRHSNIATDGRLRKYMGWTDWSNRFLVRHPFLGPAICFAIGGVIIGFAFLIDAKEWSFFSLMPFVLGFFLLIYALLRKFVDFPPTRYQDSIEEPSRELLETKKKARQRAVASWRRRARQDRHRRRNPGGW